MLLVASLGLDIHAACACDRGTDWKDRADWTVERGIFFKPDAKQYLPNVRDLLPLIVIGQAEADAGLVAKPNVNKNEARIVAVEARDGKLSIAERLPAVFVMPSTIDANGAILRQWTFVWWVASPEHDTLLISAIRMTLGAEGRPIVWEALNQGLGTVGLFAAESFAKAIRLDQADPPDWMPSDILNSDARCHATLVRVLADGPTPMGPMIYCDRSGSIATAACRCMPSQVEQVVRNDYYRVVQLDDLAEIDHLLALSGDAGFQKQLNEWRRPTWLAESLRWPKGD